MCVWKASSCRWKVVWLSSSLCLGVVPTILRLFKLAEGPSSTRTSTFFCDNTDSLAMIVSSCLADHHVTECLMSETFVVPPRKTVYRLQTVVMQLLHRLGTRVVNADQTHTAGKVSHALEVAVSYMVRA